MTPSSFILHPSSFILPFDSGVTFPSKASPKKEVMSGGWKPAAALAAALLGGCASLPDPLVLPYVSTFSDGRAGGALPGGWEPWTISRLKKPTQYRLIDEAGRTVVRA